MEKQVTRDNSQAGFSLIELLVVVAIIGVLASAGIVGYTSYIEGVRTDTQKNNAQTIAQALKTTAVARVGGLTVTPTQCAGTATARDCAAQLATEGNFKSVLLGGANVSGASYIAASGTSVCAPPVKGLLIVKEASSGVEGAVLACDKDGSGTALSTVNFGTNW